MPLHFLNKNHSDLPASPEEEKLAKNFESFAVDLTLEWIGGQYWLHSFIPEENPIGIEVDKILQRHKDFFKRSSIQKEVLARAIGIKGADRPKILDLTAGLLGDTLLFLSFGCEVRAVERNPLIAFLIRSALKNAQHPALRKLTFEEADALKVLNEPVNSEVIYFDPMFEDANAKSLPKKEMRIFRELIKEDLDAELVLENALKGGVRRVVVKRPRLSRSLTEKKALEFTGKATRYDVYFPFEANPLK